MKGRLFLLAICAVASTTAHGDSLNCRLVGYCDTVDHAFGVALRRTLLSCKEVR